MKHMKYASIKWLAALIAVFAVSGCLRDRLGENNPQGDGNDTSELAITLTVPGERAPVTRSIADGAGEEAVKTLDVFVFDGSSPALLLQRAPGTIVSQSTTGSNDYLVQFKVKLFRNSSARTLSIVANASDEAATAAVVGATKPTVLAALTHTRSGAWKAAPADYTPIPMFGEVAVPSGISYGMDKITGVSLVRMLARIDVVNNAQSVFALDEIYLVNRNTRGYIASKWDTATGALYTEDDNISAPYPYPYTVNGNPYLPANTGAMSGEGNKLPYTYAHNGGVGLLGEIYTYEANKASGTGGDATHTNAVCLILKGTYGGATTYYRVDFTDGKDADGLKRSDAGFNPSTVDFMPVYRNHKYTFTIEEANAAGYASFGEALGSLGILNNLKTELHVIDRSEINNINYNGEYYLGLGNDLVFSPLSPAVASAICETDYPSGWTLDTSKGANGIEYIDGAGWLTVTPQSTLPAKLANLSIVPSSDNMGGSTFTPDRSAWVHVKSGLLTNKLKVTQLGGGIVVTPAVLTVSIFGTGYMDENLFVDCVDTQGNPVEAAWTLTLADTSWCTLSLYSDGTNAGATVSGVGSRPVYYYAPSNFGAIEDRATKIYLNGVSGNTVVNVIQPFNNPAWFDKTYVGAFWRADQIGERLITIPATPADCAGDWKVRVVRYGGFSEGDIVFSTTPSLDPGVGGASPADMIANDAVYTVNSTDASASGTVSSGGNIFFRVGLKSKWSQSPDYNSDTAPARYAVLELVFGNGQYAHLLFLRQGHEDDYLMRKKDNNTAGTITTEWGGTAEEPRSLAAKFSPYNLTAAGFLSDGNANSSQTIIVGARNGKMVEYPSQAGALWKWMDLYGVTAYNPTQPTLAVTGWTTNFPTTYWGNTLPDNTNQTYESCPSGYRLPTDGSTTNTEAVGKANPTDTSGSALNVAAKDSERGQSLYANPIDGNDSELTNSVWGYYADGFFDRRTPTMQTSYWSSSANSAVSTDQSTVAYIGRLYYNPNDYTSLFFPAAGQRNSSSGYLLSTGDQGCYWSSSSVSNSDSAVMFIGPSVSRRHISGRSGCLSVRCVKN